MNLPVEVIEAINDAKCILFVGSRFTSEAAEEQGVEYPDNKALAKALGWKRPRQLMGSRAKGLAIPSPMDGAASYQQAHSRLGLQATMKDLVGATDVQPEPWHRSAISRFPLIFTTCRDDLLERTAADMGAPAQVLYRGEEVPQPDVDKRVIYKINGGFEKPSSLVLTKDDRTPLPKDVQKSIRKLIRGHVILFVGYRPDHEEFELVFDDLSVCYGGELPRCHLAVAQGKISDVLWQKWVWRGLLMFTADPSECMHELEARIDG